MSIFSETFLNPVYPKSFPDPFVIKFRGEYFAYCTDFWHDGKVFGILKSRDLVNWTEIGSAMNPLEHNPPFYWAPEVTYSNGKFYLYYSVGNETLMEIRVAVSARPDGGFVDSGKRLTFQDFAIDGHVFTDENGQKYLFYATDFLEHSHIGTGTVVDRMLDFFTLEGNPRPVTRAKYDWQIYDAKRVEKGGVRWHTVEGAFILKRKGVYYEMFSGGNWQNVSYGVSFATTDDIERSEEWKQFSDGEKTFPILRTIPEKVVGPGHNSVVRGLNNRETYCVYHCWTENGRVLAIDRMDFAGGDRIFIKGATTTPQPQPFAPAVLDFFDDFSAENWQITAGNWSVENNQIISDSSGFAELACQKKSNCFLLETSFRLIENKHGNFGISLKDEEKEIFKLGFSSENQQLQISHSTNGDEKSAEISLSPDFDFQSFHLLQIEADHFFVRIKLDERVLWQGNLENEPTHFSFFAQNCRAAFSGVALTFGFENLFETDDLKSRGWKKTAENGFHSVEDKNLILRENDGAKTVLQKNMPFQDYELSFNFSLLETFGAEFKCGFFLSVDEKKITQTIWLERMKNDWILQIEDQAKINYFLLPDGFSMNSFHQLRFIKSGGKLQINMEAEEVWTIDITENASSVNFFVQNAAAAFDMIRVTAL